MPKTLRLSSAVCLALIAGGATAQTALSVEGQVETTAGGVIFPDATTQTTAARREFYAGVLMVAKSGGQLTSIQAALDSISDAAADKPYLVWVAPGVYAERVTLKSWVDVEGSGPGITVITASGGGAGSDVWTVQGADNAALRSLTVENTGGAEFAQGIYNFQASPTLHDLVVEVGGATSSADAIFNDRSSPSISEVTISGVSGAAPASLAGVASSNESSAALRHVDIDLSGPGDNRGIDTFLGSSAEVSFSHVAVREGSVSEGIVTQSTDPAKPSSISARHLRIEIAAGTRSYGVRGFFHSTTTLDHVEVEVKGTTSAWAIDSQTGGPVTLLHSRAEAKNSADDRALSLFDGTIEVGNSLIDGSVSLGGTSSITCVGAFEDGFTALDATCQ